jgi:hypothetical protein
MKTAYSLYKNSSSLFYLVKEKAYTLYNTAFSNKCIISCFSNRLYKFISRLIHIVLHLYNKRLCYGRLIKLFL